jgi:hypothetical protein
MRLVAVGGSDAGISAGLRARELDPTSDVTVVVATPTNFSIWHSYHLRRSHALAKLRPPHARTQATGMRLRLDTATSIDARANASLSRPAGDGWLLDYDE